MAQLGAGCAAPVGAWAHLRGGDREPRALVLRAVVTSLDG
ncbi:MAG: hydroxymethylbilane synthase, partial [Rothia aeria]